jgi:transposase-like protein
MSKRKRRTFNAQFKFRVALEAAKGLKSINEIAADHKVHPNQVSAWKSQLIEDGTTLFERRNARNTALQEQEALTEKLERKVGQLVIERDFLVKKCEELGIDP